MSDTTQDIHLICGTVFGHHYELCDVDDLTKLK